MTPLITAASLKTQTAKDLAQMAKEKGVSGWHSMRKEQLVKALLTKARSAARKKAPSKAGGKTTKRSTTAKTRVKPAAKSKARKKPAPVKKKSPGVVRKVRKLHRDAAERELLRDLSATGKKKTGIETVEKDRVVLMVRDPFWLHVHWQFTRQSVERAKAALGANWVTSTPIIRLVQIENNNSNTEQVSRDIEIHGGVNNWYIDVSKPPLSYRAAIGYLDANGKFYQLLRSNAVTTPTPGSANEIDENWTDVARNYEKVYAMSGGLEEDGGDLQDLFEERLRRPMGAPIVTRYGVGADGSSPNQRNFSFEVDAEMIIYGQTSPDAYVTLANEPVTLRTDGSFTVRLSMPDRRQVLPIVASSGDGVEQHTTVLAIERNTKTMEPKIRDPNEPQK